MPSPRDILASIHQRAHKADEIAETLPQEVRDDSGLTLDKAIRDERLRRENPGQLDRIEAKLDDLLRRLDPTAIQVYTRAPVFDHERHPPRPARGRAHPAEPIVLELLEIPEYLAAPANLYKLPHIPDFPGLGGSEIE